MIYKNNLLVVLITLILISLTGCYSVFTGGTGGTIVDSESTSTPKDGIAAVDVYAYTDESQRNSDFSSWTEGKTFTPAITNYYGHTTTDTNGDFVISKLVWKNTAPTFGKDADTIVIYLLFYHENYGLTKGSTLIVSDSTSDTIYQELTAIRKTTTVNFSFNDVTSNSITNNSVSVIVTVPQTTSTNTTATAKKYSQTITGNGSIIVSYPRYQSDSDKANEIETKPLITINYTQNIEDDEVTWKACHNKDNEDANYAFMDNPTVSKTISGNSYNVNLYGKPCRLSYPTINGQYKNTGTETDDGVEISMKAKETSESTDYTIDCGITTTNVQDVGSSGTQTHGNFSGLGSNYNWKDTTYTGLYSEKNIALYVNNTLSKEMTVRSDMSSYTVQLQ